MESDLAVSLTPWSRTGRFHCHRGVGLESLIDTVESELAVLLTPWSLARLSGVEFYFRCQHVLKFLILIKEKTFKKVVTFF